MKALERRIEKLETLDSSEGPKAQVIFYKPGDPPIEQGDDGPVRIFIPDNGRDRGDSGLVGSGRERK